MNYNSTYLQEHHDVSTFDCGVDSLNRWLRQDAMRTQKANIARAYVWTLTPDDNEVLAYFAFAPTAVIREDLSSGQAGGQSGLIPGYLLARLALDVRLQGQGLGSELLVDAIGRLVGASEAVAGRLIAVDAIDDRAVDFYLKHDFEMVKVTPMRLILKMTTARRLMGLD